MEVAGFYINPLHMQFALSHLSHNATVEAFLTLLDDLDELDRDRLLGLPAFAMGVRNPKKARTEDEKVRARYDNFKGACRKFPSLDQFTIYAVVMHVLNVHRNWSDYHERQRSIEWQKSFIPFAKDRGNLSTEEIEDIQRRIEEQAVNQKGDVELARQRYNLFCEKVVRPLLEMK